ncbi:SGNH/GDSL hydrolase family protein [Alicyclobacillus cycloheptanicus]|uniref:SGNH hydrolase-type esterase domain-containing protein n=1 Tax=Alicyclobacillus cycloheptanicus TaxID=1457 RepID=A0ABT9XIH1_9BACL|nr:SGNH/GDSL hydrolase family protein [Alicyclobacillus cycloheptanicus]MDQ0190106.1 hypothetical protein [Alicyclobacillus cycloheptanicus]WDM02079.1 SGNH/GDSL hydrolase family protein [Alicyclobacillus cycloheptanicus]
MRQRRKLWKAPASVAFVVVIAAAAFAVGWRVSRQQSPASTAVTLAQHTDPKGLASSLSTETVDVFGGSMAHGWADPHDDSYLKRAFAARQQSTNTNYHIVDRTVDGGQADYFETEKPGLYESDLKTDKPQIVVLSWGLLNDMHAKSSLAVFDSAIHDQIAKALAVHAVVLLVTPPVTEASQKGDHPMQEVYIAHEIADAQAFHSKNVYVFDVYHQMEAYLKAHHQTWQNYYGDSWHPDAAGHALAGALLANDLVTAFGSGPIRFTS